MTTPPWIPIHTVDASQVPAGTPEGKAYQRIIAEKDSDSRLQLLVDFEKQFPQSKALPMVFLETIDIYRQKGDRPKVIEYGKKTLRADKDNLTAMMVLARNYALEGKELDRSVLLAQQTVDGIGKMKSGPTPEQYSTIEWMGYLKGTETAANEILQYAAVVRERTR